MYDVLSIRRANPIAEVIANSGVELRKLGQRLTGRCPFHTDAQPSLVVYPQDANYFCFGCSAGGDVIDFVGRVNGVGFKEAASLLSGSSRDPRQCNETRVLESSDRFRAEVPTEADVRVIEAAAKFYHDSLWCSPAALAYLAVRGIERRTARDCRIGFGAQGLAQRLRRRGLSLEAAERVGLLCGKRETMLGRIIVPDMNGGRPSWMTGRARGEATPRYMNLRLPTPLLGVGTVRDRGEVIVAEGVFDWLTLVQWGLPAIALLGTRISKHTVDALRRFKRVYIALDSDDAGRRASAEMASALAQAAIVELPPGVHDLNDLGRFASGRQVFERCLELATNGKENQWERTDEPTAQRAA